MGYNPFEGKEITGKPVTLISGGRRVVENGELIAAPGDGRFIARERSDMTGRRGSLVAEMDPASNFGAKIAP